MTDYVKITLVFEATEEWPRPDKTDWQRLIDHTEPVEVVSCEYIEAGSLEEALSV